ncbi:MAG: hypothetical protein Q8K63_00355, partial [Acidimicrobiales bacterium]|nr:hypothetical protein [Acidimicrobiales bacterium]
MNHFSVEGTWWFPEEPSRRVPGTLTFYGDTPQLVLYDALRAFEMPAGQVAGVGTPAWEVEPFLHGRGRDGSDFTLVQVGGANLKGPFTEVRETYEVGLVLEGCHSLSDRFSEAWISFDYLEAWADPPPITSNSADDSDTIALHTDRVELLDTIIAKTRVRLVCGTEGTSGQTEVKMRRWTAFAVTPASPLTNTELLGSHVRPLQDLLMFCLGRPVAMTGLQLSPTDAGPPQA